MAFADMILGQSLTRGEGQAGNSSNEDQRFGGSTAQEVDDLHLMSLG